jgi:hypothetical protein
MTNNGQEDKKEAITMFGFPLYDSNPSVNNDIPTRIKKTEKGQTSMLSMITPDTGELVASGALLFVNEKETDSEEFVKLYKDGIRHMHKLTKPGYMIFVYVYDEVVGKNGINKDTIALNAYHIQKWDPAVSARTYNRGLHELLEKKFLFRSTTRDVFFINVRYLFNGDRMGLLNLYRRRINKPKDQRLIENQHTLELEPDNDQK